MFLARRHSVNRAIAAFCLLTLPCLSLADTNAYNEFAFIGGGETMSSTSDEDLYVAGGLRFAFGVQQTIGDSARNEMLYTLGYLWDEISASNGRAEFDVIVLDIAYQRRNGPHRFGYGASYHSNPEYVEKVDGFAPFRIDFDDALGFTTRYSYTFGDVFMVGGVITIMDYEADGESFDANSLGAYIASYF